MTPTPRQMGTRLKRLRGAKHMSQAALAKRAGLTRESVNELEAGNQDPSSTTISASPRLSACR